MLYTHPNKLRSLEKLLTNTSNQTKIIIVIGPPSSGKKHTIIHCLKKVPGIRRFSTFEDSISNSKQAFVTFLQESAHSVRFINGCPFFALDDFKKVLDEINSQPGGKMIVIKLTVEAETVDVIWKFKNHPVFKDLQQIVFNKVANTYLSRWINDQVKSGERSASTGLNFTNFKNFEKSGSKKVENYEKSGSRTTTNSSRSKNSSETTSSETNNTHLRNMKSKLKTKAKTNEFLELADGQFERSGMVFSSHTNANKVLHRNLTHFHALGKVLYNKFEKSTGKPENTADFIVDNQPSGAMHFQDQIIKYLPDFNEKSSNFKNYTQITSTISNTDQFGLYKSDSSLHQSKLKSVISSIQAYSTKNVAGKFGHFSKQTVEYQGQTETEKDTTFGDVNKKITEKTTEKTNEKTTEKTNFTNSLENKLILFTEKRGAETNTNFKNNTHASKYTTDECNLLIESSSDEISNDDLDELEFSFSVGDKIKDHKHSESMDLSGVVDLDISVGGF